MTFSMTHLLLTKRINFLLSIMAGVFYRHDSICLNKFVKKTYWGKFNFFISDGNLSSLEILISVRLFCKLH